MSDEKKPAAALLQPLTFGGVARFAEERLGRLLLAQCLFALFASACVVAMLGLAYFPVVDKAIALLPDSGAIMNGELQWPEGSAPVTSQNRVLGLAVEPGDNEVSGLTADQRIILGRKRAKIAGLMGYVDLDYPTDRFIPLNRHELTPSWGAWRPVILVGSGVAMLVQVFLSWIALATLYCVPVRLIAMLLRRKATIGSSWKLAAAALLPGSLVMDGAILLYTLTPFSPVGVGLAFIFHFVTGWVYAACAPFKLPGIEKPASDPANPFAPAGERAPESGEGKKRSNPFADNSKADK